MLNYKTCIIICLRWAEALAGEDARLLQTVYARDRNRLLASFADPLQGFVVDGELAFLLQAVFESCAEGVEGGALLGLKELLLDLFLLLRQIFGENGLMGDDFVDD